MHFFDNNSSNLNLADELKKNEDLEYLNKENIFLITEIDKFKKRNSYLEDEVSKLNHKNFELQTCINTLKNSKPFINNNKNKNKNTTDTDTDTGNNDYCCFSCICF